MTVQDQYEGEVEVFEGILVQDGINSESEERCDMKTEQSSMLRRRIRSRRKGLVALMLAMMIMVGMMLPAIDVWADDTDNYYLIMGVSGYDALLCHGKESIQNQHAHDFFRWDSNNGYVEWGNSGNVVLTGNSPLSSDGPIGSDLPSQAVEITVPATTYFYFGATSGGKIEVVLDGVSQGYNSGTGTVNRRFFSIPAGKYTVQHTANATYPNRWIVNINTAITSISLSPTTINFTVGDSAQSLTVSPSSAKVVWTSDKSSVATVDDGGNVKPIGVGTATITATLESDDTVKASCAVTVDPVKAPELSDDQKPKAKSGLIETGSELELVSEPRAKLPDGYTMNYALGENDTKSPTYGWSTAIPTGTNAGTYYVWYKAVGDDSHSDSTPKCVTVTIAEKSPTPTVDDNTGFMLVTANNVSVKSSVLSKKARTKSAISVLGNRGIVTYELVSAKRAKKSCMKRFKVNMFTGQVKVKKGTKKGNYRLKVAVTDWGNYGKLGSVQIAEFRVKVK